MKYFCALLFITIANIVSAQRVLIIGIDGARSDVAEIANTPNLDILKSEGIYSPDAINDDITISGPGWSAILCGVWSDKHLVTGNNFDNNNYAQYPSLFHYIEEYDANLKTLSLCHWSPINNSIIQSDADLSINFNSDAELATEAVSRLSNNNPDVIFLHFDDVDHAGHANGFSADVPAYISAIEDTDVHIGSVLEALKARPDYISENWIVIVTSDHGGINFSHGGSTFEEENVMFILGGESIPQEVITKDSTYTAPINCLNDSTQLVFDGQEDYVNVPYNSLFDFGDNQDFTIECRVKTGVAADVSIIGNKDWDSGFNKGFVFSFKIGGSEWKVNIGDGNNRTDINLGGSIADNEWHTLSVSFDRDGMMKMYEDGIFIAESDISNIGDINNNQGIFMGADINQSYDYTGSISEVRIWNSVLSTQEIQDFQCSKITNTHPSYNNLIGYWQFNEGASNTQANDTSPNNNPGTITNAKWTNQDSFIVYDYDKTPRLVDVPVNIFAHLCIPIQTEWELEGDGLIPDCTYNNKDCVNPKYNQWIGPDTGLWNIADHWSRGHTPIICDNVVIPSGSTVNLLSTDISTCNSLKVEDGGHLNIESGGQLTVIKL